MAKKNSHNEKIEKMQASAATAEPEVQTQDDREYSYTQSDDSDDDDGNGDNENIDNSTNEPADNSDVPAPVEAPRDPVMTAFRRLCEDNPDMIHEFHLSDLIADPARNGRFNERTVKDEAVKDLAEAIKARGKQLVPGEVTLGLDDKLYITAGTGRYLALSIINATRSEDDAMKFRATVLIETPDDPAQSLIDNAMENWHREDLTVLDKVKIIKSLMAAPTSLKQVQVSQRLGVKRNVVSMLVRIGSFPESVIQMIAEGKIAPYAAYDLSMVDPDKIEAHAKKLVEEAGGKRVTRSAAAAATQKKRAKKADVDSDGAGRVGKKQRTAKQVLDFIESEATTATCQKYKDKALADKLKVIGKFVNGGSEETFLKNLAAL